jgi:probable F420-dependent oxidoreductase
MKFWQSVAFTDPTHLVPLARAAEEAGFHGIMVSEHLFFPQRLESKYPYSADGKPAFGPDTPWPDPFAVVGALAAVTTRLRFLTGVSILPLRHPIEVAKQASTVAVLSDNRFALGVGAGWMREEFVALGREFKGRGRRLDEMIEVIRKLCAGGMVAHRGEHYAFDALQISPVPTAPLPMMVGGASEAALRRAARLDGWIGSGDDPATVPGIMARLRDLRREAGRERAPFETVVALTVPPDVDLLRRLEDGGVTAVVSWPLVYTLGPAATVERECDMVAAYGRDVIAHCA